jgi:hypothetical protein
VLFDVAPSAATGKFDVVFSGFPATSLSDPSANDVPITTFDSGSIQIEAATVPEPRREAFVVTSLLVVLLLWRRFAVGIS